MMAGICRRQSRMDARELTTEFEQLGGLEGAPFEEVIQLFAGIELPHAHARFEYGTAPIDLHAIVISRDLGNAQVQGGGESSIQSHFLVTQKSPVFS